MYPGAQVPELCSQWQVSTQTFMGTGFSIGPSGIDAVALFSSG